MNLNKSKRNMKIKIIIKYPTKIILRMNNNYQIKLHKWIKINSNKN